MESDLLARRSTVTVFSASALRKAANCSGVSTFSMVSSSPSVTRLWLQHKWQGLASSRRQKSSTSFSSSSVALWMRASSDMQEKSL